MKNALKIGIIGLIASISISNNTYAADTIFTLTCTSDGMTEMDGGQMVVKEKCIKLVGENACRAVCNYSGPPGTSETGQAFVNFCTYKKKTTMGIPSVSQVIPGSYSCDNINVRVGGSCGTAKKGKDVFMRGVLAFTDEEKALLKEYGAKCPGLRVTKANREHSYTKGEFAIIQGQANGGGNGGGIPD